MTADITRGTNPHCGDVRDPDSAPPRVLTTTCGTCISRRGHRMHLPLDSAAAADDRHRNL